MGFWELWNLSFGFFGVQVAYALQSANISRVFATLGADPHSLSYFWILPPLMGMLVQPVVGTCSDRTWSRFGRRVPYLFIGAAIAVFVLCLLPNAGSLDMTASSAMVFGILALMFLDTSINMSMQPFKMLVGDMVNEKQKGLAYSIQSFLCSSGSVTGFVLPFLFTALGIANIAPEGVVPDSVIWSFYTGAVILVLCVVYTAVKVREWPPRVYAKYNGSQSGKSGERVSWITLLRRAPATFWRVGLVQFFCWSAFMYMWAYTNGAIADTCWGLDMLAPGATASEDYQEAGNWVGVLYAVQAVGSVLWAMVLPLFRRRKLGYSLSLALGGAGFALMPFISNPYAQFVAFLLIGCAWAAMMAMPFAFVTNALQGYGHMGAYLGLFNGTICVPQIVAALLGGTILSLVGSDQSNMMLVAGSLLMMGSIAVTGIKAKG